MGQITISGTVFDVYGTEAGAADYFKGTLASSAWSDASSGDKKKSQISAARWLDRQSWVGEKTSDAQPLAWPRTGVEGFDDATTPDEVIDAEYELILILLNDPTADTKANTSQNTKRVKAGSAEVEFFGQVDGSSVPTIAHDLIKQWLTSGASTPVGLASGTEEATAFCPDDNKLTRGYP